MKSTLATLLSFACLGCFALAEETPAQPPVTEAPAVSEPAAAPAASGTVTSASALSPGDAKIFQLKGDVRLSDKSGADLGLLKRGQTVQQGAIISTGENAGVMLIFSNGASLNIGAKTKIEISVFLQEPYDPSKGRYAMLQADPSNSKMHAFLHHGELIGTVKKLKSSSTFTIETPIGSSGVRGTTFFVSYGINNNTGNYMMQVSNFDGEVYVESPIKASLIMTDGSLAAGEYNPYSGPKLYDVPRKALIIIEADKSLNLGDKTEMPRFSARSSFGDFFKQSTVQVMLQEIRAVTGRGGFGEDARALNNANTVGDRLLNMEKTKEEKKDEPTVETPPGIVEPPAGGTTRPEIPVSP